MKKVFFASVLAFFVSNASAQTQEGKVILGAALTYESIKVGKQDPSKETTVLSSLGLFVARNAALGLGAGYTSTSSSSGEESSAFILSPFARGYKNISARFKFFGEIAVPLAWGESELRNFDEDFGFFDRNVKTSSIGIALSPGFAFFPTKKLAIELSFKGLSYQVTQVKDEKGVEIPEAEVEAFSIGTNFFTPAIGVKFHL